METLTFPSMTKTLAVGVCLSLCAVFTMAKLNGKDPTYSNIWVANIEGGEEVAQRVARDLGYTYKGQLGQFKGYYELVREDHPEVSLRHSDHLTTSLLDLDEVKWAKQQMLVRPVTHDLWQYTEEADQEKVMTFLRKESSKQSYSSTIYNFCRTIFSCITYPPNILLILGRIGQGDITNLGTFSTKPAPQSQLDAYSKQTTQPIGLLSKKISAYAFRYNDPFWRKQWYMQDYRGKDMPVMDLNVVPVHKMGYTGANVVVGVIDNGVEENHPDLRRNVNTKLSYDMCNDKPGCQPTGDSHGTNCAGVIAMEANNKNCGVGIAYNATIVGIRALCDNKQIEHTTAKALIHHMDKISIYSCSWGSDGKGKLVFIMDDLTEEAYRRGANEGRNGKGVIYVRSAGNDKDVFDNCATDPEVNSVYAITIAAADQWGVPSPYSERCTAVMATAYSKSIFCEGIVAPELNGGCYTWFTGTSAACPLASGIIALVLEANSKLTYRDVMHLITMSAEVAPLANNKDTWYNNARGLWVSNDFGFGLMNAENMVTLAKTWANVPKKHTCIVSIKLDQPEAFSVDKVATVSFTTSACEGSEADEVNYLEHVEVASLADFPYRGHIEVHLQSPAGTLSKLLELRPKDDDKDGLEGWSIMSTHNWGEHPKGEWKIYYKINRLSDSSHKGLMREVTVKLHGTAEMPAHYKHPRQYAAFRLPDGQTSTILKI